MNGADNPKAIINRPGLSALAYRVGDYTLFRQHLLAKLSQELPALKTRDPDDSAIALLDAWAVVADVLTFYQERIANEGFLNTATERQSIIELARLIGYELKPGVAASTQVAFRVDDKPGGASKVEILLGTQIMSIPNEGGAPQIFETSETIEAQPEWNALKPRLGKPQEITRDTQQLYLTGISTQLSVGDWILLRGYEDQDLKLFLLSLNTVQAFPDLDKTLIVWNESLDLPAKTTLRNAQVFAFRQRAGLFGNNAPRWENVSDIVKRNASGIALKGGVFASAIASGNAEWTAFSEGLPNQDILCLLPHKLLLFAGTAGGGIFRRDLSSETSRWEAVNTGLTNLNIQALYVDDQQGYLLAGTPSGGVFRSKDNGENWSAINTGNVRIEKAHNDANQVKAVNTGLPNVVVRSFLSYGVGTTSYIFAGTDDSIYRSTNQGQDWSSEKIPSAEVVDISGAYQHLQGLPDRVIYALLHVPETLEVVSGKVQSSNSAQKTVTIQNATATVRVGSAITIDGQTRAVIGINSIKIKLEQKFDPDLNAGASFESSTKSTGRLGTINDLEIEIQELNGVLRVGESITAETQTRKISAIQSYSLTLTDNFTKTPNSKDFGSVYLKIFAATDRGIYISTNHGEQWVRTSSDDDKNLSDKVVYSLASYTVGDHRYLLAGTSVGIWSYSLDQEDAEWVNQTHQLSGKSVLAISTTEIGTDQLVFVVTEKGVAQALNETWNWQDVNQMLITTELTSIVTVSEKSQVLVGARFSGFTEVPTNQTNQQTNPSNSEQKEWANFYLKEKEIDLDNLYPKVLKDSWIVLIDESSQDPAQKVPVSAAIQVADTAIIQRQDFSLDIKITRIIPEVSLKNAKQFSLRTTIALIQSESLSLALESLTVPVQKNLIFRDPLWENKIFLNQYTHGLTPGKTLIVSGKNIRARVNAGGIYRSKNWKLLSDRGARSLVISATEQVIYASNKTEIFRLSAKLPDNNETQLNLAKELPNQEIRFLFAYNRIGIGRIASNTGEKVRFESRNSVEALQPGDIILADKQTRTVIEKTSELEIKVDSPFSSDVWNRRNYVVSTIFIVTNLGVYRLNTVKPWSLVASLNGIQGLAINQITGQLFAGTEDGVYQLDPTAQTANKISLSEPKLIQVTALGIYATAASAYLFAATAESGIFRSMDNGSTWRSIDTEATTQSIQSLVVNPRNGDLFIATSESRLFHSIDRGNTWNPIATDLTSVEIQSLVLNPENGYLFIGTAKSGVFRSIDQGDTWESISAGLPSLEVHSLTIYPTEKVLFVSTPFGIFRSTDNGNNWQDIQWEHTNRGLTNKSVRSLVSLRFNQALYLFAGTRAGVFRSKDQGMNWEPVNQGLRNIEVQALLAQVDASEKSKKSKVFAGTQEGLFYSSDRGKTWEPIKLGIARPNIQALYADPEDADLEDADPDQEKVYLFAGTSKNGIFRSSDNGQTWTSLGLSKQDIRVITSGNDILVTGTYGNGIFVSKDNGNSWKHWRDTRPGSGKVSSEGTLVTGDQDTNFATELQIGDTFEANGQTRTVIKIDNNTVTVDLAFKPALKPTEFTIHTGLTNLYITALAIVGSEIFVGTAGSGVFRSRDQGQRWEAFNNGLNPNDLEIRCLSLDANTHDLLVGTATTGVFRWDNKNVLWKSLGAKLTAQQTELVNIDVRTILSEQSNLYIGGVGILPSRDQLTFVELQSDDLLRVTAAPTPLATDLDSEVQGAQQWSVLDRNTFQGKLIIAAPDDIQLDSATDEDPIVSEICQIQAPPEDEDQPILTLAAPLQNSYDPASVSIYANVVKATHGETIREILGSGNGSVANQKFVLNKPPLTYTFAATPSGGKSTLHVYVNDVEWQETDSLYPLNKQDQKYIVQIEDDGTTILTFGDGQRGARLPSGRENISAVYRSGIGLDGLAGVDRVSQKKTGPASILSVTNPCPATGAAPRESIDSARSTVPALNRTLGRIVSIQDFEDFTFAFAGIGKARAIAVWNGATEIVHITIAAIAGAIVEQDAQLYRSLVDAIATGRDPLQQVEVASFEPIFFKLDARFVIQTGYQVEKVEAAIRQQLLAKFAFEQRGFAQPVTQSEVIAAIQSVPGVLAVDLDALHRRDASRTLQPKLLAEDTRWNEQTRKIQAAQLLLLPAANMTLTSVSTL